MKRLFNVVFWYADNACEVLQVVSWNKDTARDDAKMLACSKGYTNWPDLGAYEI